MFTNTKSNVIASSKEAKCEDPKYGVVENEGHYHSAVAFANGVHNLYAFRLQPLHPNLQNEGGFGSRDLRLSWRYQFTVMALNINAELLIQINFPNYILFLKKIKYCKLQTLLYLTNLLRVWIWFCVKHSIILGVSTPFYIWIMMPWTHVQLINFPFRLDC